MGKQPEDQKKRVRVRDPEQKKADIIDAAARLFAQKGVAATTMREIASESGAGLGLVTYHFKDKNDILSAVMLDKVVAEMGTVLAAEYNHSGNSKERLERLFSAYAEIETDNPLLMILALRGLLRLVEGEENPMIDVFMERLNAITKIVEDGMAAGEFKDIRPEFFSTLFLATLMMQPVANLVAGRYPGQAVVQMSNEDNLRLFKDVILNGIEKD